MNIFDRSDRRDEKNFDIDICESGDEKDFGKATCESVGNWPEKSIVCVKSDREQQNKLLSDTIELRCDVNGDTIELRGDVHGDTIDASVELLNDADNEDDADSGTGSATGGQGSSLEEISCEIVNKVPNRLIVVPLVK